MALVGAMGATLNEQYLGGLSYEVAMDAAEQYLRRAKMLAPNSEAVLAAEAMVGNTGATDWITDGGDRSKRRFRSD